MPQYRRYRNLVSFRTGRGCYSNITTNKGGNTKYNSRPFNHEGREFLFWIVVNLRMSVA